MRGYTHFHLSDLEETGNKHGAICCSNSCAKVNSIYEHFSTIELLFYQTKKGQSYYFEGGLVQ